MLQPLQGACILPHREPQRWKEALESLKHGNQKKTSLVFNTAIDRFTCTGSARTCVFRLIAMGGGPTSLASCWWLSNVVSTNANDGRIAPSISILAAKNIGSTTSSYLPIYPISMQYPITSCQLPINFPSSNMFSAPVSISPTTSRESPTLKGGDRNISGELDGLQHHLIPRIIRYC